jgi:hypothetical protein
MLKVNLFHSKCSDYQNPQSLKEEMAKDPSFYKDCAAILGPNQPSITTPDPTATGKQFSAAGPPKPQSKKQSAAKKPATPKTPARKAPSVPDDVKNKVDDITKKVDKDKLRKKAIQRLRKAIEKGTQDVEKLRKRLEDQLGVQLPKIQDIPPAPVNPQAPVPTFPAPGGGTAPTAPQLPKIDTSTTGPLLDYLFAP